MDEMSEKNLGEGRLCNVLEEEKRRRSCEGSNELEPGSFGEASGDVAKRALLEEVAKKKNPGHKKGERAGVWGIRWKSWPLKGNKQKKEKKKNTGREELGSRKSRLAGGYCRTGSHWRSVSRSSPHEEA